MHDKTLVIYGAGQTLGVGVHYKDECPAPTFVFFNWVCNNLSHLEHLMLDRFHIGFEVGSLCSGCKDFFLKHFEIIDVKLGINA